MQTQAIIGEIHGLEIMEGDVIEARRMGRTFGPWQVHRTIAGREDVPVMRSLVAGHFRHTEYRVNRDGRVILDRRTYWARVDAGL
jgi:hypothetical protein